MSVVLGLTLATVTSGHASASDSEVAVSVAPEEQARAQALFDEARSLLRQSRFDEACGKFAESYRLDTALGTLINLATCQELGGKLAAASTTYAAVVTQAAAAQDIARKEIALARIERLRPKLSTLRIEIADAMREQQFSVELDGIGIAKEDLSKPMPLDGGSHDITVKQPAHVTRREVLQLAPSGEHRVFTVLPLEHEPTALAKGAQRDTAQRTGSAFSSTTALSSPEPPSNALRVTGVVAFGLGASAIVIGSYFGISAYTLYHDSNDAGCDESNRCLAGSAGLSLRNRAIRAGNVATWTFLAGGLLASTGVVLYIVGKPRSSDHSHLSVTVGPELRLQLTRAF